MRYFWTGLVGLSIAVAIIVSAALVLRYLPTEPDAASVETRAPAQQADATPHEPAKTPASPSDRIAAEGETPDATASVPAKQNESAATSSGSVADGDQIVAEFVPTIPSPVPPSEPLEIVPGGILNFRSLPPEAMAQERPAEPPAEAPVATAAGATIVRLRLTPEQAEKVRDILLSHTIMQSEHEFPIRVGGTVPQNVELTPLPREVAKAVPSYTNYSYVFTQNQLVIVITTSRQIDLLIPA